MASSKIFQILGVFLIVGCASQPKQATFRPAPVTDIQMDNGLKLMVLKDDSLPRFQLSLVLRLGARMDPAGKEGLNNLMVALLDQGTKNRSAEKLAHDFNDLGTEISQTGSHDTSSVTVSGLVQNRDRLLELFADVILNPSFEPQEIERTRQLLIASQKRIIDAPSQYANARMDELIYSPHPYGRLVSGTSRSLQSIGRSDIQQHYLKHFRPQRAWLLISGRVDDAFVEKVKKTFAGWKKGEGSDYPKAEMPRAEVKNLLFSKEDLVQTEIRLAQVALPAGHPDERAFSLANFILGAGFSSRLNDRIRDDLGLTYGASSSVDSGVDVGVLKVTTFSRFEVSGKAVHEIRKVLQQFVEKGVTEKELQGAKSLVLGQFPASVQTPEALLTRLVRLRVLNLPDANLYEFPQQVERVTLEQVNAAIRKYFHPDKFKMVVFSSGKKIQDDLKAQGESVELIPALSF